VPSPSGQVMSMLPNKVSREPIFDGRVDLAVGVENDGDFGLARRGKDAVVACRPGRPETKGKVERNFFYAERNLLNGRTFTSFDHLNEVTANWPGLVLNQLLDQFGYDSMMSSRAVQPRINNKAMARL